MNGGHSIWKILRDLAASLRQGLDKVSDQPPARPPRAKLESRNGYGTRKD